MTPEGIYYSIPHDISYIDFPMVKEIPYHIPILNLLQIQWISMTSPWHRAHPEAFCPVLQLPAAVP